MVGNFRSFDFSTPKPHQRLVLKHLAPATKMIVAETCRTRVRISNIGLSGRARVSAKSVLMLRVGWAWKPLHQKECSHTPGCESSWFFPRYNRMQQVSSWACPASRPTVGEHYGNATDDCTVRNAPGTLGPALGDKNNAPKNQQPSVSWARIPGRN